MVVGSALTCKLRYVACREAVNYGRLLRGSLVHVRGAAEVGNNEEGRALRFHLRGFAEEPRSRLGLHRIDSWLEVAYAPFRVIELHVNAEWLVLQASLPVFFF